MVSSMRWVHYVKHDGGYITVKYRVGTLCQAQWVLYVKHSGYIMSSTRWVHYISEVNHSVLNMLENKSGVHYATEITLTRTT
jgi:hypothetical protein